MNHDDRIILICSISHLNRTLVNRSLLVSEANLFSIDLNLHLVWLFEQLECFDPTLVARNSKPRTSKNIAIPMHRFPSVLVQDVSITMFTFKKKQKWIYIQKKKKKIKISINMKTIRIYFPIYLFFLFIFFNL